MTRPKPTIMATLCARVVEKSVGYTYDVRMEDHYTVGDDEHPERPERHAAIVAAMKAGGYEDRCVRVPSRLAVADEYLLIHSASYVAAIEKTATATRQYRSRIVRQFENDVYVNSSTWNSALLAMGSALEATASVVAGRHAHAVCVIRPPGHHACSRKAMGFCFLNTVATCAKMATKGELRLDRGTPSERKLFAVEKVLILDFDIHHGNGTQAITYDDPNIMYFSIHRGFESKRRCPTAMFYPGTGLPSEVGAARGSNVNVRWSEPGMGDAEYGEVWRRLLIPVARDFAPGLILISAGFDAARGDPLGECDVSPAGYYKMLVPLADIAPICLCLEGGYNVDVIGRSFCACCASLLGETEFDDGVGPVVTRDDARRLEPQPCLASASADMNETILAHARFWPNVRASLLEDQQYGDIAFDMISNMDIRDAAGGGGGGGGGDDGDDNNPPFESTTTKRKCKHPPPPDVSPTKGDYNDAATSDADSAAILANLAADQTSWRHAKAVPPPARHVPKSRNHATAVAPPTRHVPKKSDNKKSPAPAVLPRPPPVASR